MDEQCIPARGLVQGFLGAFGGEARTDPIGPPMASDALYRKDSVKASRLSTSLRFSFAPAKEDASPFR
ncbi:MAG: hypothetical protein H6Q88_2125 [Anaeromyxobacteraceae bacterium]|nr:hypothetical protein [Anaeromyxobacteraceae bacterium]